MKPIVNSPEPKNFFSRRAFILGWGKAALGSLLLGRLFYLGVYRSGHYQTLADKNRIKLEILVPQRGVILDRYGNILAHNQNAYRLVMVPENLEGPALESLQHISQTVDLEDSSFKDLLKKLRKHPKYLPFTVREDLSWEEVCKLEVDSLEFPGFYVDEGSRRFYPHGKETAHLIGYVQAPSEKDSIDEIYARSPDFRLGREGIEKMFDKQLQGHPGYKEIEVNALRKVVRHISEQKSIPGAPLHLSIDLELQKFMAQCLEPHASASAVVLDIYTGEILGLVSHPSFDPNLFTDGIPQKEWSTLLKNPYGILNNKCIKGLYAPGSLFKMVVALAGLEAHLIDPHETVNCPGYLEYKTHRYHCWVRQGHGPVNLTQALTSSCDVYFYRMGQKIGIDRIEEMAQRLGFGQKTGVELPSEKEGLVPGRAWKKKRHGKNWTPGDTYLVSIGQGPLLATPLQMALLMAQLMNGGKYLKPTLLQNNSSQTPLSLSSLDLNPSHLELIKQGLDQASNQPGGTSFAYRILEPGFEMGGKTATSQVRRISMKERKTGVLRNEDLVWKERDHAMFGGYAPIHNPRYTVLVTVEHGGGGGRIAAPLARDILLYLQKRRAKK